jgi:hypothetical protein
MNQFLSITVEVLQSAEEIHSATPTSVTFLRRTASPLPSFSVKRHVLVQRPVPDHHSCRVTRSASVPLQSVDSPTVSCRCCSPITSRNWLVVPLALQCHPGFGSIIFAMRSALPIEIPSPAPRHGSIFRSQRSIGDDATHNASLAFLLAHKSITFGRRFHRQKLMFTSADSPAPDSGTALEQQPEPGQITVIPMV